MVKMTNVRCLIYNVAQWKWPIFQLDINSSFLHYDLNEEVYMVVLEGVIAAPNHVYRLKNSLYGLK